MFKVEFILAMEKHFYQEDDLDKRQERLSNDKKSTRKGT
jgi:hypothetical protein